MVYGVEVVLPPEVTMGSLHVKTMMKPRRTGSGVMISTWSTSEDGNLLLKMHATGRRLGATISSSCEAESSKWMISSFGKCLTERA
jgi:hypothetical protein